MKCDCSSWERKVVHVQQYLLKVSTPCDVTLANLRTCMTLQTSNSVSNPANQSATPCPSCSANADHKRTPHPADRFIAIGLLKHLKGFRCPSKMCVTSLDVDNAMLRGILMHENSTLDFRMGWTLRYSGGQVTKSGYWVWWTSRSRSLDISQSGPPTTEKLHIYFCITT